MVGHLCRQAILNYRHYPVPSTKIIFGEIIVLIPLNVGRLYEMQISSCSCGAHMLNADTHSII